LIFRHQDSPDQYVVTQTLQTPLDSRNMIDPVHRRVFIVFAEFGSPAPGARGRTPLPGSSQLVVIEPAPAGR